MSRGQVRTVRDMSALFDPRKLVQTPYKSGEKSANRFARRTFSENDGLPALKLIAMARPGKLPTSHR